MQWATLTVAVYKILIVEFIYSHEMEVVSLSFLSLDVILNSTIELGFAIAAWIKIPSDK